MAGRAAAPALVVALHDVAPRHAEACRLLRRCLHDLAPGLPVSLLVVPRYHGELPTSRFVRWLDGAVAHGDELVLHGYRHLDELPPRGPVDTLRRRWYTASEGEFAAIDAPEAARRLRAGRAWFERQGWPLSGFVAPAWLLGAGAWAALRASGFEYTCTLSRLIVLPDAATASPEATLRSQSIVYSTRSAWRRRMSCAWNAGVAWHERRRPLLRFELHPADVLHAPVRRSWMRLLEQALGHRDPVTLLEAARRLRTAAAGQLKPGA